MTLNTGYTTGYGVGISAQTVHSLSNGYGNTVTLDLGNYSRHPEVKKYEVIESPEDLLALSTTWRRLRAEKKPNGISKLLDAELFKYIEQRDREQAKVIRDYYSKKIMMWNLKSIKLSNFRQDMNRLVHSDGLTFKENMQGLAYRLPYFYEYDTELDEVRTIADYKTALTLPREINVERKFQPLKKLNNSGKSTGMFEYWLMDLKNNCPCNLKIDKQNPLLHMWDHLFSNEKVLTLAVTTRPTSRDDFQFFNLEKWKLTQA